MPETTISCYWQIARTYLRRKMMWLSSALLLVMFIALTILALHAKRPQSPSDPALRAIADSRILESVISSLQQQALLRARSDASVIEMLLFLQACFLITILIHLKQQIASPRAVLVPHFRGPHLLVAAGFAMPIFFLGPLAISAAFSLPALAVLATATLFFVLVFWGFYLHNGPIIAALMALWLGSFTPYGQDAVHAALANSAIWQNLLLITLALAALLALARRLMLLREEMPEYSRQIATNQWQTITMPQNPYSPAPQINYHNPLNRLFYAAAHRELARLAVSPPASLWARLQRWRLAGNPVSFTLIVIPILLMVVILWKSIGAYDVQPLVIMLLFYPVAFFPQAALVAWRTAGIESLRPLSRADFLRQRAAAFALFVLQIWLTLALTLVISTFFLMPAALAGSAFWLALVATLLLQFPSFATFIWFLRYRSPLALLSAFAVFAVLGVFPFALCTPQAPFSIPLPWLAAIFLAILLLSALLLRDAYHRWLRTDLA